MLDLIQPLQRLQLARLVELSVASDGASRNGELVPQMETKVLLLSFGIEPDLAAVHGNSPSLMARWQFEVAVMHSVDPSKHPATSPAVSAHRAAWTRVPRT